MRSCSDASSSSGSTGTASWARIGPASTSRVATWTVQPVTFTPCSRASRTACQPLKDGSSAGWVFRIRSGKAAWMASPKMVPKPAITTSSTSWVSEHVDDLVGVRVPVEVGPEAGALHEDGVHIVGLGHALRLRGPVDDHERHRDPVVEDGLQEGPAPRRQHRDAHAAEPTSGSSIPRTAACVSVSPGPITPFRRRNTWTQAHDGRQAHPRRRDRLPHRHVPALVRASTPSFGDRRRRQRAGTTSSAAGFPWSSSRSSRRTSV